MVSKVFPRREIYVCTFPEVLGRGQVRALNDRNVGFSPRFTEYAERRWELDNQGWVSSVLPSAVEVERDQYGVIIHCGLTDYKFILGQFKRSLLEGQTGITDDHVHGLSIEMFPVTLDGRFFLQQRTSSETQHSVGFYDIPTATYNAEMHLARARDTHPGLVRDIFDMFGFPLFNFVTSFHLSPGDVDSLGYVGFSRGFESTINSQFNGHAVIKRESGDIMRSLGADGEHMRVFSFDHLLDVFDCIDSDGIKSPLKEDANGRKLEPIEATRGFGIIDNCLGTLLSVMWHENRSLYESALSILQGKGYKINEVRLREGEVLALDTLH